MMKAKILIAGLALLAAGTIAEATNVHAAPSCNAPTGSMVHRCRAVRAPVHAAPMVTHRRTRAVVRNAAPCRCRTVARASSRRIHIHPDAGYAYAQSGYNYHSYSQAYGGGYAWQGAPYGGEAVRYDLYRQYHPYYAPPRTYQYGDYYGYNVGDGGPGGDRADPWAGYDDGPFNGY